MSVPCSSRWTAKACLSECGVIGLENLANTVGLLALLLNRKSCDVPAREVSWEEPVLGLFDSPPGTQDLQEFRAQHRIPIFLPFTLLNPDDHAFAVDGGRCECDGFGDTQACGIARGQDGAMFPAVDAVQELKDFLRAEDIGQFLGRLGSWDDVIKGPVFFESDSVEEAQR